MSASEPNAPIQPGAIVELHSLSKVELNGVRAEAGEFDEIKGRRGAALEDGRFLGVKVPPLHPLTPRNYASGVDSDR